MIPKKAKWSGKIFQKRQTNNFQNKTFSVLYNQNKQHKKIKDVDEREDKTLHLLETLEFRIYHVSKTMCLCYGIVRII